MRIVGNSIREKRKSKHKLTGTKVCKAEQVRKYLVNPTKLVNLKIENENFG